MAKLAFIKDALILFAITLIAGTALGGVFEITKAPIAEAGQKAKLKAYSQVLPAAASFDGAEVLAAAVAASGDTLMEQGYGNVYIDEAVAARDAGAEVIGYVISSTSKDGYGGEIKITVGIDRQNKITGISYLSLAETPGLGMNATKPKFQDQYAGKEGVPLSVIKTGDATDTQINAISGATITSKAVTNAVNAATYFAQNCIENQGGGADE